LAKGNLTLLDCGRGASFSARSSETNIQKKGRSSMLIIVIILLLVLGGGGGYYGHSRWGYGGSAGIGIGTILLIVLAAYLLGGFN
jgi:hypothetical protein